MHTWFALSLGIMAGPGADAHPDLGGHVGVYEPILSDRKTYSESHTSIAWLDDGTYVQAQLAISNLGLGNGKGVCRVLVVQPGQPPWSAARVVDRDGWAFRSKPAPSLQIGPCRVTATGSSSTLDMQLDDGTVLLTLARQPHATVPPGHPVVLGDATYAADILIPFAPADVTLVRPGGTPVSRRGHGYADHSRSTTLPGVLARGWLRFRGFGADCSTLFLARFPADTTTTPASPQAYWWREGASRPERLAAVEVTLPPAGDLPPGWRIGVASPAARFSISLKRLLYRDAPLEGYGFLGRALGAVVGNVVTRTFEAELNDDTGGCRGVRGVLEVDHSDG